MPESLRFQVPEHQAGQDLAHVLAARLDGPLSVRAVRRWLETGSCQVNGQTETYGSRKLAGGDVVVCLPPSEQTAADAGPDFERHRVLYCDDQLVAYDKPPHLPVTPPDRGGPHLLQVLAGHLGRVEAVHRLDADTSGVVLLARDPQTRMRLERLFGRRELQKHYQALVHGRPPASGSCTTPLTLVEQRPGWERWAAGRHGERTVSAETRWKVVDSTGRISRLAIEILTGRTHQIRVHLAHLGFPVLGDRTYGHRRDPAGVPRQMLHAWRLRLIHPTTQAELRLQAVIPADFAAVMAVPQKG